VSFSPDGTVLAGGGSRGRVQLWDTISGRPLRLLPAHAATVASVAFSPDEKRVACGYRDGTARIWRTASGKMVHQLHSDVETVQHLAWSPNGKKLATCYFSSNLVDIWDTESGEKIVQLNGLKDQIESLAWSPDGKTIATGGAQAQLWDVESGNLVLNLAGHGNGLAWSPADDSLAIVAGGDVRICRSRSTKVERHLYGSKGRLRIVAWSPDGKMLAAAGDDQKVYLWNMETGRLSDAYADHQTSVVSLTWLEDGGTLVSGSRSEVCLWQPRGGKLLRTMRVDGGAVGPNGRLVASRGQSVVGLHQLDDGKKLRTFVGLRDKGYLALSPAGHWRGSPEVEKELVYVVQTDEGQAMLTPKEFAQEYNWKNDPEQVGTEPPEEVEKPEDESKAAKNASPPTQPDKKPEATARKPEETNKKRLD